MTSLTISISEKWEHYLKQLTEKNQVELNSVINELFAWAFSNPETKKQFEAWLDDAFPSKGEVEDKERSVNEEISDNEEYKEEKIEEEAHEDRDYSEDRKP